MFLSFELQAIKSLGAEQSSDQGQYSRIKIFDPGRDAYVTTPIKCYGWGLNDHPKTSGDKCAAKLPMTIILPIIRHDFMTFVVYRVLWCATPMIHLYLPYTGL